MSSSNGAVLVLGASGMLGHKLFQVLSSEGHAVVGALRATSGPELERVRELGSGVLCPGVDVRDARQLERLFKDHRPAAVVNAVGVVKQLAEASIPKLCIEINALLPHVLAELARQYGARLIHVSTDCVFDGLRGGYRESDPTNAADLYGRTKALGEVLDAPHVLTLRTSIIGHELGRKSGLLEWLLSQPPGAQLRGFRRAIYSGLTTHRLAKVISRLLRERTDACGLYHVVSERIDKYALLTQLAHAYHHAVEITAVDEPFCDRSLDGEKALRDLNLAPASWSELIPELVTDAQRSYPWRQFE